MNVKDIPLRQVITSFSGLRAHEDGHEFIIGEVEDAKGFIDCAGIESPGLTSAPAIGEMVAQILKEKMNPRRKRRFCCNKKRYSESEYTQQRRQNCLDQRETGVRKYYLPL